MDIIRYITSALGCMTVLYYTCCSVLYMRWVGDYAMLYYML